MDIFKLHEVFEIEVLDKLNSAKLLDPLVFGGGTMLRLCHELTRYSVDLDFWFIKETPQNVYFDHMREAFAKDYEITDAQIKRNTLLLELRSARYPKRLKIEIRRELREWDYQRTIAFTKHSTRQVLVKAHTLQQTMENKIHAFLARGEIRDCFDIEFLVRRGAKLPIGSGGRLVELREKMAKFKDRDFKVKLGSILEKDIRAYYIENRFSFLDAKLAAMSL